MIKYLGSKRTLIDKITPLVDPNAKTVLDVFAGTCRVGYAFKQAGFRVISNDINRYSYCIARCYIEANKESHENEARDIIHELNALKGIAGYVTETFCNKSRFFHPKNGERIDAIRDAIDAGGYAEPLKSVLITSLIEAADRVDSTCGVQMAYLKKYAPRAMNDLLLQVPFLLPQSRHGQGMALCSDAVSVGKMAGEVDIAYLDPPYNQHSYLGNYHVWESIAIWDKPEVYGKACKRVDVKERKSDFNSRRKIAAALTHTLANLKAKQIIVSFNDEGYLSEDQIAQLLSAYGDVNVIRHDYRRYIGSKIGVYNPQGQRVGTEGKQMNQELIFTVKCK